MNVDLYTALPPGQKEEYKKLFTEPDIDYPILPAILIDESVPCGYSRFGDELIKLPDAQTYTSEESDPVDLYNPECVIEDTDNHLKKNALIQKYILMDRFKVQMEICANDFSFCRLFFERGY